MFKPNAKFVSAIFAGLLAGAPFTTMTFGAAHAAEECLSGPKQQTPHGAHWYYRTDHATKRHCWYLGEEQGKQTAPPNSSQPATQDLQKAEAAVQPSIENAHAELPAQQSIEPPNRDDALPSSMSATPAIAGNSTAAPEPELQRSLVASRWPGERDASPPADPVPNERDRGAGANPASRSQPPIPAAGPFTAADMASPAPTHSMPMQLAALMGALAVAGMIGSIVFKFGNTRRAAQAKARARRGAIWESANFDAMTDYPGADARGRRPDFSRASHDGGDRDDRIAEFFSHLSRRSPT